MEIINYATKITYSINYQEGSVIIRNKKDIT